MCWIQTLRPNVRLWLGGFDVADGILLHEGVSRVCRFMRLGTSPAAQMGYSKTRYRMRGECREQEVHAPTRKLCVTRPRLTLLSIKAPV